MMELHRHGDTMIVYRILHSVFERQELACTNAANQRRSDAALDTR